MSELLELVFNLTGGLLEVIEVFLEAFTSSDTKAKPNFLERRTRDSRRSCLVGD